MKNEDNTLSFSAKKREKELKERLERVEKLKEENQKTFIALMSKNMKDLTDEEFEIYGEVKHIYSFMYKDRHYMYIVEFRGKSYVVHDMVNGSFEYIGPLEDLVDSYIKLF